jgi:NET1-associated nuclear protein 1 (U3 small nucleolar RNA-associated protein 17)
LNLLDSDIENQASSSKPTSPPLAYHRLSSSLILPSSHPQSLQIYSPSTSTLLSELEVSPSNRVSRRDDKPLEVSHVDHVALSSCGLWMATLDTRNGELGYPPEIFLKIWAWSETASEWSLHSRIDQPHGNNHISNIAFGPQSGQNPLYLSSCCEGGTWKIWRLTWKNKIGA